jgi:hypothetical protein
MGLLARDGRPCRCSCRRGHTARHRALLVLTEPSRASPSTGIDAPPVPSLLRGFSAPVLLDDGLDDAACWCCWRTTATPSTAGKPASAWRWAACWRRCGRAARRPLDGAFVHACAELLRATRRWTRPSRNWC